MSLERYIEDKGFMKKIKWLAYIGFVLVILFDIGVHLLPGHAAEHFFGDKIWGFWAIFGFVICILMILICKGIGHAVLMKKENYYD